MGAVIDFDQAFMASHGIELLKIAEVENHMVVYTAVDSSRKLLAIRMPLSPGYAEMTGLGTPLSYQNHREKLDHQAYVLEALEGLPTVPSVGSFYPSQRRGFLKNLLTGFAPAPSALVIPDYVPGTRLSDEDTPLDINTLKTVTDFVTGAHDRGFARLGIERVAFYRAEDGLRYLGGESAVSNLDVDQRTFEGYKNHDLDSLNAMVRPQP